MLRPATCARRVNARQLAWRFRFEYRLHTERIRGLPMVRIRPFGRRQSPDIVCKMIGMSGGSRKGSVRILGLPVRRGRRKGRAGSVGHAAAVRVRSRHRRTERR